MSRGQMLLDGCQKFFFDLYGERLRKRLNIAFLHSYLSAFIEDMNLWICSCQERNKYLLLESFDDFAVMNYKHLNSEWYCTHIQRLWEPSLFTWVRIYWVFPSALGRWREFLLLLKGLMKLLFIKQTVGRCFNLLNKHLSKDSSYRQTKPYNHKIYRCLSLIVIYVCTKFENITVTPVQDSVSQQTGGDGWT